MKLCGRRRVLVSASRHTGDGATGGGVGPETRARLVALLSPERVVDDATTLCAYGASLACDSVLPACVVYPQSTDEISGLVRMARAEGLALHAISRGKNFGYGDAQGTAAGQVIVDLSRMDRVVEVDEALATVRLQPGVSQAQLHEALRVRTDGRLVADMTGAGAAASVVGNVLERGFGHSSLGDRFAAVLEMTVVLADGSVISTGMGAYPESRARGAFRWGVGPVLDGLFSQSSFGIVTEMVLELIAAPEVTLPFAVSVYHPGTLGQVVTALRELRMSGVVDSAMHIANPGRAIGSHKTRLIGLWNASGELSGPREVVRAKKRALRRMLRRHLGRYRLVFLGPRLVRLLGLVDRYLVRLPMLGTIRDVVDLHAGIPTDHPLQVLLDESGRQAVTSSTRAIDFPRGFRWVNAVVPARAEDAEAAVELLRAVFERAQRQLRITMTFVSPRALILISEISFAREPAEVAQAKALYEECRGALDGAGYHPYRSGSGMYAGLPPRTPAYQAVLDAIKAALDPDDVLSPGKYGIAPGDRAALLDQDRARS